MIQDLHSHTYYSFCSDDHPEDVVKTAIASNIDVLGISDHNYGIALGRYSSILGLNQSACLQYEKTLLRYRDHIDLIAQKYAKSIRILKGIELCTSSINDKRFPFPTENDISFFDYALIEHLDYQDSVMKGDLFSYAKNIHCTLGVAHTDLFAFCHNNNLDPLKYFNKMAECGIFWEINVNYDSIHGYREHEYVEKFFTDQKQQAIIKQSGVKLSVGFDGHRFRDYCPERIIKACNQIKQLNIPLVFDE
jgi:histidinol phosphatase-like PHP family hydrolase